MNQTTAIFEVPAMRRVFRIVHVVYIVAHLGTHVEVLVIPGGVVARRQVFLRIRLIAVICQAVEFGCIPGSVLYPVDIPHPVGEGQFFPLPQIPVDVRGFFEERHMDSGEIRIPFGSDGAAEGHLL